MTARHLVALAGTVALGVALLGGVPAPADASPPLSPLAADPVCPPSVNGQPLVAPGTIVTMSSGPDAYRVLECRYSPLARLFVDFVDASVAASKVRIGCGPSEPAVGALGTIQSATRRARVTWWSDFNRPQLGLNETTLRPAAQRLLTAVESGALPCAGTTPAGTTPSATAPAGSAVRIDHLEVVQVVQDTTNSVPLVPGKKTVVRAFVRSTGKSPVPNVTGTLSISGARSSTLSSTGPISAPTAIDRANIGHSLLFVLPTALTAAGVYQYALSVTYPTLPSGTADSPDLKRTLGVTIAVNPRWPELFTIGTLPLCIGPADPNVPAGPWPVRPPRAGDECANEEQIAANDALLSKLFPAGPSSLWYTGISTPALTWTTPLTTSAARNRLLILLRKLYAGFVADGITLDQLVGWLPATADTRITDSKGTALGSVGGLADTAKVGGHAVWVVENGARDPRLPQFALSHELGHNLGLFHISPNDNPPVAKQSCGSVDTRSGWVDHFKDDAATIHEVGFDTEAMKVIPSTWFDLMSYCYPSSPSGSPSPGIWISAYQYRLLLGSDRARSAAEAPLLALGDPASFVAAPRGDGLVVSGTVRRDGSAGSLDPAYRVTNVRLDVSDPKGDTCLRGDTGMSPFCFSLDFTEHTTKAPLDAAGFSFTVPIAPSLGSVSLTRGGRTIASLVGKPAPLVAITAPSAATPLSGTVALQWTAPGALGTAVSYSPDGKRTWIPLAVDLTGQSLSVDTTKLLAGSSLSFRVTASSGIVSASAESGPFTLTSGRNAGYPTRVAPTAGSATTDQTGPGDIDLGYGVLATLAAIVLGGIALLRRRGRRMVAAPAATPRPPTQSMSAAPPRAPTFCASCGQPRRIGAKFCGSCGQPDAEV